MQPPPRKVKPSVQLKTVHVEQLNKLQQKYQQELDILEDIRLFTKQRSTIEKEYAQALSKLATQYLSKRDFGETPKIESEDGKPHRTLLEAWKSVLEESDRTAKVRVQAAETLLQRIYEPAKTVKTNKSQTAKKVFEHTASLHKELAQSISEMTKSQKIYNEEEHLAHEARGKASEANEKIRNRSTGIFTSMASLQKNSAKLNSRKESCEIKATASRNDYLLMLTAANAHQMRYYDTDLPDIMQVLDGETFDKIQEFFTTLGKTELDCAKTTLESFSKVLSDADLMSRNYNLQVFLHKNLVFTNKLQYNFEPMDGDPNSSVCNDATASLQLEKEARKWATRIAKEGRVIRDSQKVIQNLTSHESNGRKPSDSSDSQSPPLLEQEQKTEEAKQNLRKAETAKCKAEARIEVLREAGVDVEQWLSSAQAECLAAEEEEIKRTNSSVSIKTASSGRGSTMDEPDNVPSSSPPMESTYINYEEDDFIDDHFDISAQNVVDTSSTGYSSGRNFPLDCVAIYDFQATNPDELSMVENENLTLIADGDGDGWVRAKNASGDMGFIPENYIQVVGEENAVNGPTQDPNEMNVDGDMPLTSTTEEVSQISGERTSAYSATDYEVEQALQSPTADAMPEVKDGTWARALYDYEANSKEELSFQEGQLIRILRKDENGVDDGWWEGDLNGTVGVFPSLVVEELTSQGQPADGDQTISDAIVQQQELYGINLPESYDLEPDMTLTSPGFVNDPDCAEHGIANVSAV